MFHITIIDTKEAGKRKNFLVDTVGLTLSEWVGIGAFMGLPFLAEEEPLRMVSHVRNFSLTDDERRGVTSGEPSVCVSSADVK